MTANRQSGRDTMGLKFLLPLLLCSTVVVFVAGDLENCGKNCWKLKGVSAELSMESTSVTISIGMQKERDKDIWAGVGLSGEKGMKDMFVMECQWVNSPSMGYAWSDSEVKPTPIENEVGLKLTAGGGNNVVNGKGPVTCTFTFELQMGKAHNFKTADGKRKCEIKDSFYVNVALGDTVGEKHSAAERTGTKVDISGLHIVINKDGTKTKASGGFKMMPIPPATFLLLVVAFYFGM